MAPSAHLWRAEGSEPVMCRRSVLRFPLPARGKGKNLLVLFFFKKSTIRHPQSAKGTLDTASALRSVTEKELQKRRFRQLHLRIAEIRQKKEVWQSQTSELKKPFRFFHSASATTSTSTRTSFGSCFAATHERAGFDVKYLPYTSLNAAKSLISFKKHVVFTALSSELPA